MKTWLSLVALTLSAAIMPVDVTPTRETASAAHQTDDPSIWVNPKDPSKSMIIGTVKMAAPDGAVVAFRLDGTVLGSIGPVDRPNNVDVAYGLTLGGRKIDIAVATERNRHALRVMEIVPDQGLRALASIPVFAGQKGAEQQPMGIGMYTRKSDGAIFAIVSRKSGPSGTYLWQYRLKDDGAGQLIGEKVREFGAFSGSKEIEAVAVDDEMGFIYYSDEGAGVRKYHADPQHADAAKELALFATRGWRGDREGLAIYATGKGKGYIIATDQTTPNSEYHVYAREGGAKGPHDHSKDLGVFRVGAEQTDGIEATSRPLGPEFPKGMFVAMNDSRKNFILVDWRQVAKGLKLPN